MRTITVTKARENLYNLVKQASEGSEPVQITGKHNNAILISESDWQDIQETLYLLSIKGMRESIVDGMNIPIEDCSEEPGW